MGCQLFDTFFKQSFTTDSRQTIYGVSTEAIRSLYGRQPELLLQLRTYLLGNTAFPQQLNYPKPTLAYKKNQ
jgi:hypothetical protein